MRGTRLLCGCCAFRSRQVCPNQLPSWLQDIPKGTELTFDYNFERYGDKASCWLCYLALGCSSCLYEHGAATYMLELSALRQPTSAALPSPLCVQPMKCLCGSKNCRGVIGGTQVGILGGGKQQQQQL